MPRRIIAFTGKMGSGKTTAAKALVGFGFTRVRFAGPLKAMMACVGLTEREIEGDLKELPCELLGGKTPRFAMQTIGTEWGRDIITPDLWINAWRRAVDRLPAHIPVVVDDCRFGNEAAAVRAAGGVIFRVDRPDLTIASSHPSELMPFDADVVIKNHGTIEQLVADLRYIAFPEELDANAGIPIAI